MMKSIYEAMSCCVILTITCGELRADYMYDSSNPRPTENDVWAAEHNAFEHGQKAAEAMSNHDSWRSIEEQQKANRARQDADEMRNRIWMNEQDDRRRRENERRQEQVLRSEQDNWNNTIVPGQGVGTLSEARENQKRDRRRGDLRQRTTSVATGVSGSGKKDELYPHDVLNPDLGAPLITDAERRILQREHAQINRERATWARRDEILRRNRINKKK